MERRNVERENRIFYFSESEGRIAQCAKLINASRLRILIKLLIDKGSIREGGGTNSAECARKGNEGRADLHAHTGVVA